MGEINGELIKQYRLELGMTQKELAEAIGATRLSIVKYERGEPISRRYKEALELLFKEKSNSLTDKYGMRYQPMPCGRYKVDVPFISMHLINTFIKTGSIDDSSLCFLKKQIDDGKYFAFEIDNNSMNNNSRYSLALNDIVLTKQIDIDNFHHEYDNKDLWIIILSDSFMCKQIVKVNKSSKEILCHSLNPSPEYSDFSIKLDSIKKIYKIVQRTANW